MPTIILLISPVAPPSNASVTDNSIQTIRNTFVKYCKYTISQIHAHHPSEEICLLYYDDDDHTTAAKNTTTTADAPPTLSTSSLRHDVDNHNNNNNNNDEQLQLIQSYSRETSLLIQSLDSFNDNNNNNNNITMYNSTRDFQQSSLSMPSSVLTQCFHHVENTLGKHSHTQIILITNYQQFDSSLYRIKPTFPAKVHLFSLYQPPTMHNMSMMTMMNNSTTIATATPTTTTTPPLMQQHQQSSSLNNTTTHKMSHNTTSNNNNNNNNNNRIEQLCEMNNGTHMYMYTHYHNHQIQQSLYDQFIVHNYNKYNGYLSYGHLISSIELHPDPNLVQWSSHHSSSSSSSIVSSSTTSTTNTSSSGSGGGGSSNSGGSGGSGASDASDSHSKSTNESENIIPHVLNIMGFVDAGCMSSAKCISRHNVLPFTPPASSSSSSHNNNSGNNSRFINTSHLSSPMMMNNVTPATPTTTVAATTTSMTPSKKKSSVDKSKKIKKKKSKQRGDSSGGDDGSDGGGDDDGGGGEYENREEEEEATTSTTPEDEQSDYMNDHENAVDDDDDGDAAVAEDDAPQKHRKTRVKSKVGTKRTRTHDNTDEASGASDAEDSEMNDSDANNKKTKQKKKKSKSQKKSKSSKSKKKSKANHSDEDGDEDEGNDKKWNNQVMLSALNQCIHGKKLTRKELEYQFGPNAESRKMIKADACKLDHVPSTSFYELLHMSLLNTRTCAIVKLCGDYYGYLGVVHDAEYSGLLLSVLDYQAINAAMTMTTTTMSGTSVGPTTSHASSANISSEQQHSDALLHQLLQQVSHTPLHHVNQAGNAVHSTIAHSVNNRPNPSATLCYPWLKDSIDHMIHYTSFKSSMEPIIEYSRQQQQDKAKKSKNTSEQQASSVIPSDETLQIEMDLLQQDYHPKLYNYNLKSVKTIVPFVKRETIHADFQKLSRTCAQLPHKMELMYSEIEKIRFTAHVYLNPTLVTSLVQLLSELKTDCVNQLAHLQQSSEDEEDQEVMIENQVLSIIIYETVILQLNANKPCSSEYEKLSVPDMTVLSSNVERKKRELGLQSLIQPPQQAQPPHQQQQPPKQPHPTLHHQQPQPQQHIVPPSHHPHPYHHPHSHPQQQQQQLHPHHQPHHQQHYSPNPPPPHQQQQLPPHHHQLHQQPHQPHHHYP